VFERFLLKVERQAEHRGPLQFGNRLLPNSPTHPEPPTGATTIAKPKHPGWQGIDEQVTL